MEKITREKWFSLIKEGKGNDVSGEFFLGFPVVPDTPEQRREDYAAALDFERENNLPVLTGTEKQIEWATRIRYLFFAVLKVSAATEKSKGWQKRRDLRYPAIWKHFSSHVNAEYWINTWKTSTPVSWRNIYFAYARKE